MAVAAGFASRIARGFTLVEVLVVLVVIGVAAALVTLGMGHDSTAALRQESERLRGALEHAMQLAQWRRTALLWEGDDAGYRFLAANSDGLWRDDTDEVLARHPLPAGVRLRALGPAGDPVALRILLRPSGRNDPFTLFIETAGTSGSGWTIRGDPLNRVRAGLSQ